MSLNAQKRALIFSALSATLFAVSGLLLGLMSGSVTIIFDSAYSLLSLLLASISLWALRLAKQPASGEFPFGRLTAEPLAILVKGIVIAIVCIASIIIAVVSIWQGGRPVKLDIALVFGGLNVAGCWLTWSILKRAQRKAATPLMNAEVRQWLMDTWLSAAVLLGFMFAQMLAWSPWAEWSAYADPVMVLLIASYFCVIPLQMIRQALHQLLFGAPGAKVRTALRKVLDGGGLDNYRLAQVGSFVVLQCEDKLLCVRAEHAFREVCAAHSLTPLVITPVSVTNQAIEITEQNNRGAKSTQ